MLSDTLNLMAVHHAADLIDRDQNADDLQYLKDQVAQQQGDSEEPVTVHDVVNLLWKYSTKNGKKLKQKKKKEKQKVYNKLMDSHMHSDNAHLDYMDSLYSNGDDGQYQVEEVQSGGHTMESLGSWFLAEEIPNDGTADQNHILWTVLGFNIDIIVIITCLAFLCCKCLCGFGVFKLIKSWIDHRRKQKESELLRESDIESNRVDVNDIYPVQS